MMTMKMSKMRSEGMKAINQIKIKYNVYYDKLELFWRAKQQEWGPLAEEVNSKIKNMSWSQIMDIIPVLAASQYQNGNSLTIFFEGTDKDYTFLTEMAEEYSRAHAIGIECVKVNDTWLESLEVTKVKVMEWIDDIMQKDFVDAESKTRLQEIWNQLNQAKSDEEMRAYSAATCLSEVKKLIDDIGNEISEREKRKNELEKEIDSLHSLQELIDKLEMNESEKDEREKKENYLTGKFSAKRKAYRYGADKGIKIIFRKKPISEEHALLEKLAESCVAEYDKFEQYIDKGGIDIIKDMAEYDSKKYVTWIKQCKCFSKENKTELDKFVTDEKEKFVKDYFEITENEKDRELIRWDISSALVKDKHGRYNLREIMKNIGQNVNEKCDIYAEQVVKLVYKKIIKFDSHIREKLVVELNHRVPQLNQYKRDHECVVREYENYGELEKGCFSLRDEINKCVSFQAKEE